MLRQLREHVDLPASVARLEVRHGAIVSILQEPRRLTRAEYPSEWSIESGGVYLHDPVDLEPELVVAMPEQVWIRRATRSRDGTRFAIVSMPVGGPYRGTVRVVGRDGAELASRSWGDHMAWDCGWFLDDLVVSTINAPTNRSGATIAAEMWSADLERKSGELEAFGEAGGDLDTCEELVAVWCGSPSLAARDRRRRDSKRRAVPRWEARRRRA